MRRFVPFLAVLAVLAFSAAAQAQPGQPVTTGQTSFTYNGTAVTFDKVSGNINESSGFIMAMITFSKTGKPGSDHLTVSLMTQKAGPVDLNQPMGNGIGYWVGGKIMQYAKGKSQCTMTVSKLTATAIEGTANCPVVTEVAGSATGSLTNVKFSAAVK